MVEIIFALFTILAIGGAIGTISLAHPLNSALSFIVSLLSIAGFFALLSAKLLFVMQIIVYAGAIMVLMVFVIMYLNIQDKDMIDEKNRFITAAFTSILISPVIYISVQAMKNFDLEPQEVAEGFGGIHAVGQNLFNDWMLPFELISVLLLVAVVGAIIIAQLREEKC